MFDNSIGVAAHSSSGSTLTTNLFKANDLAGVTLVNSANNELSMQYNPRVCKWYLPRWSKHKEQH